jgi:hypothetical protein
MMVCWVNEFDFFMRMKGVGLYVYMYSLFFDWGTC